MSEETRRRLEQEAETRRRLDQEAETRRRFLRDLSDKSGGSTLEARPERHDGGEAARLHYRLLSRDDLAQLGIRYSRIHLHRLVLAGKFPKPVKLGAGRNAWVEAEVLGWIEARIRERDAAA